MSVRLRVCADPRRAAEAVLPDYLAAAAAARDAQRCCGALWLTPSQWCLDQVRRLICQHERAIFAPQLWTMDGFAEELLRCAGRPASAVSPVVRRQLLRAITRDLAERGQLPYFRSVAHRPGFLDVVGRFISELKHDEVWPEQFLEVTSQTSNSPRDTDLGRIYSRYQDELHQRQWYDQEGRMWLARTVLKQGDCRGLPDWSIAVLSGFSDFRRPQLEILEYLSEQGLPLVLAIVDDSASSARPDLFAKVKAIQQRLRQAFPRLLIEFDEFDAPVASSPRLPSSSPDGMSASERGSPSAASSKTMPPPLLVRTASPGHTTLPAGLATIRRQLFANPRDLELAQDAAGVQLVTTTGPANQIRSIARRLKSRLASGCRPDQLLVVVRRLHAQGPEWYDGLTAAGLPVWMPLGTRLLQTAPLRFLLDVLRAEVEDWSFDALMSVWRSSVLRVPLGLATARSPDTNSHTAAESASAARDIAQALRRLQLARGREVILYVLRQLAGRQGDGSTVETNPHDNDAPRLPALAARAERWLTWYSSTTAKLRQSLSFSNWIDAASEVLLQLAGPVSEWAASEPDLITPSATQLAVPSGAFDSDRSLAMAVPVDRWAWDRAQSTLRDAAAATQHAVDNHATALGALQTLEDFLLELTDLLAEERLDPPPYRQGQIRLLGAEQARHVSVPELFLVDAGEEAYPQRSADDCLITNLERERWSRHGVHLRHAALHQQEEMELFWTLCCRADRQLTISYASVDHKGQPAFPSPYVSSLRQRFAPGALVVAIEGQLDPVPQHDDVLTTTDARLFAMHAARNGRPGVYRMLLNTDGVTPQWSDRTTLRHALRHVLGAVDMAVHRFHTTGFTAFEGRLEQPDNLRLLAQHFRSSRQFSATELENFAQCPFRFWVQSLLQVKPLRSPEADLDHRHQGAVLHQAVAELFQQHDSMSIDEQLIPTLRQLLRQALGTVAADTAWQAALLRLETRILEDWAPRFLDQTTDYVRVLQQAGWRRWQTLPPEIAFGKARPDEHSSNESYPAVTFGPPPEQIHVAGRIDRIDLGEVADELAFIIIDYKTHGRPRLKLADISSGQTLQLAVYAVAAQRLGLVPQQARAWQLGYWALMHQGFDGGLRADKKTAFRPVDDTTWQDLEQRLEVALLELVRRMRAGQFVVENSDQTCTGKCDYRTVCRVQQLRPLADRLQKRSPPFTSAIMASEPKPRSSAADDQPSAPRGRKKKS
jgi:ATP-dependent helicase/nuclease subunit B